MALQVCSTSMKGLTLITSSSSFKEVGYVEMKLSAKLYRAAIKEAKLFWEAPSTGQKNWLPKWLKDIYQQTLK